MAKGSGRQGKCEQDHTSASAQADACAPDHIPEQINDTTPAQTQAERDGGQQGLGMEDRSGVIGITLAPSHELRPPVLDGTEIKQAQDEVG
ncbi:MAG: hypothetical protein K8963_03320 [Proteobacteria bacterium]|nr:hypothetical protein [Pseudomonadota bacterium]